LVTYLLQHNLVLNSSAVVQFHVAITVILVFIPPILQFNKKLSCDKFSVVLCPQMQCLFFVVVIFW